MNPADRQRMLIENAVLLDLIEATAGTDGPSADFRDAADRLSSILYNHEDVTRALYGLARLAGWSMDRRAQAEGGTFADAMLAVRLELMKLPGQE